MLKSIKKKKRKRTYDSSLSLNDVSITEKTFSTGFYLKKFTSFRSTVGFDKSEHACRIAVTERVNNG